MTSTDITIAEPGGYVALTHDTTEVAEILAENLGGEQLTERDLLRVKIPTGGSVTWEIPGPAGVTPSKELTGILVHFKFVRGYWPEDSKTGSPPACHAEGPDTTAIGIGDPGGPCKTCRYHEFGSEPKNGRGRACKDRELWFMLQPGTFLPVVVSMSPMSLKAAGEYRKGALGAAGIRTTSVITAITLEADTNDEGDKFARAVPRLAEMLSPEEAEAARKYAVQFRPMFDAAARQMATEGADVAAEATTPAAPKTGYRAGASDVTPDSGGAAFEPAVAEADAESFPLED